MSAVPYGDRNAMVKAIVGAIKKGGLFAVDVDIVPTKIGQACHVWLPAATSGEDEPHLDERRAADAAHRALHGPARPGHARLPDRGAHRQPHGAGVARAGQDATWPTSSRASTGRPRKTPSWTAITKHEKGGEFVTYARLRAMGTNGFQEPADRLQGRQDRRHQAALCRRQVRRQGRQGHVHGDAMARPAGAGQGSREEQVAVPHQQRPHQHRLAERLSRPGQRVRDGSLALSVHPDEPATTWRSSTLKAGRSGRGLQRQRLDPGDGLSDADREAQSRPSCCSPIRPACRATWSRPGSTSSSSPTTSRPGADIRKIADAPEAVRGLTFKSEEYSRG